MRLIRTLSLEGKIEPLPSRSLKEDDLYVIFSKERVAPAFVETFSEALRQFKQTEAFRAIYRKYFPASRPRRRKLRKFQLGRNGARRRLL